MQRIDVPKDAIDYKRVVAFRLPLSQPRKLNLYSKRLVTGVQSIPFRLLLSWIVVFYKNFPLTVEGKAYTLSPR